ncbi:hypothetical protein GCM10008906_04530 [Clostridium oceanicum]|uniref:Uncharacterized protein n=1 Tax=Clostridium oceanicum TaxID=1543 RepID=A0ABN1JA31_9CLOT
MIKSWTPIIKSYSITLSIISFTSFGSGASPSNGFNVSFIKLIPEYIINNEIITPKYPSIGKDIHLLKSRDKATKEDAITSLNASKEEAFSALEFILFPIDLLNELNHNFVRIDSISIRNGIYSNLTKDG